MNHLKPADILETLVETGVSKAESSWRKLLILGILAGAFISFAGASSTLASYSMVSDPMTFGVGKAFAGVIFTGGLIFVVLAGAELFTGNSLISLAVYEKRITLGQMLRNWGIVYIANFIGSIFIVLVISHIDMLDAGEGMLGAVTVKTAAAKVNMDFSKALLSGLLCNWLVCLAVWCSTGADSTIGKIFSIFFPIWIFVISGFEHCIANMYFIPAGIIASYNESYVALSGLGQDMLANLTWQGMFLHNMLPVTIGNLLGGVVFVAASYWISIKKS